jgi:hypothetical protein
LAENRGDEWRDQPLHHGIDDLGERSADDDGDRQVDDVAFGDELAKALEHRVPQTRSLMWSPLTVGHLRPANGARPDRGVTDS